MGLPPCVDPLGLAALMLASGTGLGSGARLPPCVDRLGLAELMLARDAGLGLGAQLGLGARLGRGSALLRLGPAPPSLVVIAS